MVRLQSISLTSPEEIQQLANNPAIALNLRDVFPYPFTLKDAEELLVSAENGFMGDVFGIYDDQTFVGCCSVTPQSDVYRMNAEIGYWIGEPYWGKGYATEAIRQLIDFAFEELGLLRVYAGVFESNTASMRVLEKAGLEKEALIQSSIIKEGKVMDEHIYSLRKAQ